MSKVRIKKIAKVPDAQCPTPEWNDFIPGMDNGAVSLPVEYEAEGILLGPIEEGKSILINRTKRNGVECPGLFSTTPVTSWDGKVAKTLNSVYEIQEIKE